MQFFYPKEDCFQNVFDGLRSLGTTWWNLFPDTDPAEYVCEIIPFVEQIQVV